MCSETEIIPVGDRIIRKIWFLSPFKNSSDQVDMTPDVGLSFFFKPNHEDMLMAAIGYVDRCL